MKNTSSESSPNNRKPNHGFVTDWQLDDYKSTAFAASQEQVRKRLGERESLADGVLESLGFIQILAIAMLGTVLLSLVWFCS